MSFAKQVVTGFPSPITMASEWRVVSRQDGRGPENKIEDMARMVAEQGRNGLFSISQQQRSADFFDDGGATGKYNPDSAVHRILSRAFALPDGVFTQEEVTQALDKFEQLHPSKPRNQPPKGTIPHFTSV